MEAQTDIQTYLEQGKTALAQGQGREAAIAYAHGAQLESENPLVHLGLAEANLALNNYGVVQMACRKVQELQPSGGIESTIAQALLDLLDRRYERALQNVDSIIEKDPSIAYVHALRSYLLRANGQDYDANLARARAARLSYGGRFEGCFPALEPRPSTGHDGVSGSIANANVGSSMREVPRERESIPTWSRPNKMRRQVIRTRFLLSQYPGLVTNTIIALNTILFLLTFLTPAIVQYGSQINALIMQGQYWRLLTSLFIHDQSSFLALVLSMISLFFVGRGVEVLYGPGRYLIIYVLTGVGIELALLFLDPTSIMPMIGIGSYGAFFGIFGALGTFYLVNRRALGVYGRGAITSWLIWLAINLLWNVQSLPFLIAALVLGGLISLVVLNVPGSKRL